MDRNTTQPIIIFGGFLSFPMVYTEMRNTLVELTGRQVSIVPTQTFEWPGIVTMYGVSHLLSKLDQTIRRALASSQASKVTLVCHSAGGVLARIYLSHKQVTGRCFHGLKLVDELVTLGSPHHNLGGTTRGGRIARYVERYCPGACYSDQVDYTTVAGKSLHGSLKTTIRARLAYSFYRDICGDGDTWGDGLVPVQSALLEGTRHIILDGVSHYNPAISPWFGSREVVPVWWYAS